MKLNDVLENYCCHRPIVCVGHFNSVIKSEMAVSHFGTRYLTSIMYSFLLGRRNTGEFFPLRIERNHVVIKVEKVSRHHLQTLHSLGRLLRLKPRPRY